MPSPRTQAQIEASRRNGARSKGPVTADGKARASRNALTHGLTAMQHLVIEDEIPDALEALIEQMTEETGAVTELEARLARRLAIAFWKCERAEKIETALFDAAPKTRQNGYRSEEADPLSTFDLRRFNAVRGYQAQQGREISRCLKELRQLRKDAHAECTGEPEATLENEPTARSCVANDDAPAVCKAPRNEPEEPIGSSARSHGSPDADRLVGPELELAEAIQAEIELQTAADEPDPAHLAALTRLFCAERRRQRAAA